MTDTFGRSIWVSVLLHLCVAMMLFLRAITMPTESFSIRDAIRVDMVDLPDKITDMPKALPTPPKAVEKAPPPAPKATAKPKAEPTKPEAPTVDLNKTKKDLAKSQKEAMNRLKAMEALDKIKGEVAKEKTEAARPVKGAKVSQGNALSGLEKIDYDKYFDEIKAKIFANWSIPSWMSDANFSATVNVQIDDRGYVTKKTLRRSSGNEIFDNHCLEAVDASSPFSEPPARLRGVLSTGGINFNFPQ